MRLVIDERSNGSRLRLKRGRSWETIDVYPTRALAEAAREEMRRLVDVDALADKHTLKNYGEAWLDRREQAGVKSIRSDRGRWKKHILAAPFINANLASIRRRDVRRFRDQLPEAGISPRTQRAVMIMLRGIFAAAIEDEVVEENPCDQLKLPSAKGEKAKSWLHPSEDAQLMRSGAVHGT